MFGFEGVFAVNEAVPIARQTRADRVAGEQQRTQDFLLFGTYRFGTDGWVVVFFFFFLIFEIKHKSQPKVKSQHVFFLPFFLLVYPSGKRS